MRNSKILETLFPDVFAPLDQHDVLLCCLVYLFTT